ncbi:hypothetical protein ATY76_14405 [Rhizobium sp. R339]|nr:hypothetical protein ATY76_14405 [Rhizobium sp. R339]
MLLGRRRPVDGRGRHAAALVRFQHGRLAPEAGSGAVRGIGDEVQTGGGNPLPFLLATAGGIGRFGPDCRMIESSLSACLFRASRILA